jgi:hypothetical protein
MRKLKLESLNVESFDTTAAASFSRGTVQGNDLTGHGAPSLCILCPVSDDWLCQTDSPEACGNTNYLDCTLACSDFPSCQGGC